MTEAPLLEAAREYVTAAKVHASLRRRFFLAFLGLATAGSAAYLLLPAGTLPEQQAATVRVLVPLALTVGLGGFLMLWLRPASQRLVEMVAYWSTYPIILGSVALGLALATSEVEVRDAMISLALWSPIVGILGFLVFGNRRGLRAAIVYLLASAAVLAPTLLADWSSGNGAALATAGFQYLLAATALLLLVSLFATGLEKESGARAAAETVANYAYTDVLTGLPNRLALNDRLSQAIALAERQKLRLAVYFIDLDGFKAINDQHGHLAGDSLLQEVARRLVGSMRRSDHVARISGDEFAVVAFVQDQADVRNLAERMLNSFAAPVALGGGVSEVIGGSIGVSLFPGDGDSVSELLLRADAAMYRAKADGRSRWRSYDSGEEQNFMTRLDLSDLLREAIARGDIHVAYQPFYDLTNGRLAGVEALARWHHPELGEVPPDVFLPIAESHQLTAALGERMLRSACSQAKQWQKLGFPELRVSVNVAAGQFAQPDFTATVAAVLQETGLAPQHLELELTEAIVAPASAAEGLRALRALGVRVSLDDFGAGYSSLMQLRDLPIDGLKIDRSFLADLRSPRQAQRNAAMVLESIVRLANGLGMTVTAEGVETEAQAELIRATGVDLGQGFLYARPVGVEALESLLKQQTPEE